MNFTLKQLGYFLAAAEHQSTTAAAVALNVSQPSVSAAIAQLEAGLGGPLFTRHQGVGLSMTPMGRRAMKSARAVLTQAADFNPGLLGADRALVGEVALACFGDLAPYYLPGLQAALRKRHPNLEIVLQDGDFEFVRDSLRHGLAEIAITYRLGLSEDLLDEVLVSLPVYAMLPARHRLARKPMLSLQDLSQEPLVLTRSAYSESHFLSLFYNAGLEPRRGAVTESFELQRGLVANGFGAALSYTRPVGRYSYDGRRLAYRPLADLVPEQPIVLVRHRDFPLSGVTKAVMALTREYFASLPRP